MAPTKKTLKSTDSTTTKPGRYVEAVGRRKTAIARVRFFPHSAKKIQVTVNNKILQEYFPLPKLQAMVVAPAVASETYGDVSASVIGGGVSAQAEAVRLGLARAIIGSSPDLRSKLKVLGYLKRDPRMVERKKPGKRKARRPQQWRKR